MYLGVTSSLSIQWRTGHNYRREVFSQCKLGNSMETLPCSLTTLTPAPDRVSVPPSCSHMPWALLPSLSWPFDCELLQELPIHRCLVKVCWRKEGKKGEGKWIWNFPCCLYGIQPALPPSLLACFIFPYSTFCYLKFYYTFICLFVYREVPS